MDTFESPSLCTLNSNSISIEREKEKMRLSRELTRTMSSKGMVTIGNYYIGKPIGEGTFGKVLLGRHMVTNDKFALKFVEKKTSIIQKNVARETKIMKLLNHPNIVRLYEVIDIPEKNSTCMVLEYINGGELFDYIINKERLEEREAARMFRQMVSAMEYSHSNLVIHRDLKPENVLLDENKNIKIMDFGLANVMNLVDSFMLHTNCGSPIYCAPEILQSKDYVGPEVDIWSLGVILYVMVTGCCPWTGPTLTDQVKKAVVGKYESIDGFVSPSCSDLIRRILTVDPKNRATLAEIIAHPWVNAGLYEPMKSITDLRQKVMIVDPEIVKQLQGLGFIKGEVERDLLEHRTMKQSFVLYHLILDQRERLSRLNRPRLMTRTSSGNFKTWSPTSRRSRDLNEEEQMNLDKSIQDKISTAPPTINITQVSSSQKMKRFIREKDELENSKKIQNEDSEPEIDRNSLSLPIYNQTGNRGSIIHNNNRLTQSEEMSVENEGFFAMLKKKLDRGKQKEGGKKRSEKLKVVKGIFAIDKVTTKNSEEIQIEVDRVLNNMNIGFSKKGNKYICKYEDEENGKSWKLDLEICQIEKSEFKGIKLKRREGSVWSYKEIVNRICSELKI